MPRAPRLCAGCGELTSSRWCADCEPVRPPSPSSLAARDRAELLRRKEAVAQHQRRFGDWCPGWERPGHPSSDLTAAHSVAVATGGKHSRLTVLCRSCNSRQGVTPTEG